MTGQRSTSESLTIVLQPIHNEDFQHVADQLLYRQQETSGDPLEETARCLSAAIYELDDGRRLGTRELFIELPDEWLIRSDLLPTPAHLIVIGISSEVAPTPSMIESLIEIRERGYRLLAPFDLIKADSRQLLPLVDIVSFSSPTPLDEKTASKLRLDGKRLMARDIHDQSELEAYRTLGFDYFNGSYLSAPTFHASRPRARHGNRAAQLRLVSELYRRDSDMHKLYDLILQMPHLHFAILRRANASYYSRGAQQNDLRRSMHLIGLHELRRLVMTLSLANDLPSSKLVVRIALIRAFMCRNLSVPFRNIDPEDAFTTGLFSMMDVLLDEDQKTLLDEVPLKPLVTKALTHREGHLGAILSLAEGHERNVAEMPETEYPDQLQTCYLEALVQGDTLMNHL